MKTSLKGFNEACVTFIGTTEAGRAVKLTANNEIAPCGNGDDFIGFCISSKDNISCVQLGGFIKVPYSGSAPKVGFNRLSADANGGVKLSENGREHLVTEVDTIGSVAGIIL